MDKRQKLFELKEKGLLEEADFSKALKMLGIEIKDTREGTIIIWE